MITNQQLVINNFTDKIKAFTSAVQGIFVQEEDFVLANTGIPTDTFNVLLPMSANINNPAKIKKGIESFSSNEYPFSIWIDTRYLNDNWQNLMREFNLKEAERNVMMKLENTVNVEQIISQQLKITQVNTLEELMEYKDVFMGLFEGTPEKDALHSYFKKISGVHLRPGIQMFIGRIDAETISTGLLIENKDSYGIYDVMTREIFRGKGYGSEMLQYILSQTKDKQKPVVLQASEDGKNIYKRFGFVDVGEMVVYE